MVTTRTDSRRLSTAVMQRRHEPADSLDFFPTPPWATRAFCTHVLPRVSPDPHLFHAPAWDPACGEGHMAGVLGEYFDQVHASDIHPYGFGQVADFLHDDFRWKPADWIITNPPFALARDFILKALVQAYTGVAMLVRTAFCEGQGRYDDLFSIFPPVMLAQYVERVPMHRGRWVIDGTSATAYCWVIWLKKFGKPIVGDTRFVWIPPSRKVLTQPDDWLRFGGCQDIPNTHKAMQLAAANGHTPEPARETAQAELFGG